MGYYVRALLCKKSIPTWKLQFVSYKTKDVINSNAQKLKKEWDVDPDRWPQLHAAVPPGDAQRAARRVRVAW